MKKLILPAILAVLLLYPSGIYAQDSKEISCDEVWGIIDSNDCKNWIVNTDRGGVWCDVPQSVEGLSQYWNNDAPKYTFAPGTCRDWENNQSRPDSETAESESSSSQSDQAGQQTKLNKSGKDGNPFNIFAINPFEAWLKLKAVSDIPQLFEDVYVDIFYEHALWGPGALEQLTIEDIYGGTLGSQFQSDPEPAITVKDEEEAWVFLPNYVFPDKENITVVKGQGQIKPPNSGQSVIVSNSSGDPPLFTTYADSIFTGSTSEMVTFRYTWGDKSGAVINVSPKTEVKILKPIQDKETQDLKRMVKLNKGELEVKVKNDNPKNKFGVQTETLDLMVIGTHFWMSHYPDKKQTMVVAYEGKVQVKTNDGKTTILTPDGDKPGVIAVSQKLSVWKLVLTGLVFTTVIGGAIFFLKRRGKKIFPSKTKR